MDKKLNVLVLFGGCSSEYWVSLESSSGVLGSLDKNRFNPVMVGITEDGKWYHYTGTVRDIADDKWLQSGKCTPAAMCPNRGEGMLLVLGEKGVEKIHIDAAFPVLHGRNGEDGTMQGLFELAGVPLVGCGTLASALCMDKDRAHILAAAAGVNVPASFKLEKGCSMDKAQKSADALGYPMFVKPIKAGSSFGVTRVAEAKDFHQAVEEAFKYDGEVIAEEAIPGFEVGCAVMGDSELVTGEIDEIELASGFFDFKEKYNLITSKIHVPARVPKEASDRLKETAKVIYKALGCAGFARVDMFYTPEGKIVFNEVNTIPGFTPFSRFPSMMKAVGVPFEEVLTRSIELAVSR